MHKSQEELQKAIADAKRKVRVHGIYSHFKRPKETYEVLGIAINEADDVLCVLYQADYGERLTFIRPLESWIERVEWNGAIVERFTFTGLFRPNP